MGRCHEFGLQIRDGCGHPMQAGDNACACEECGVVCGGRFAGCPDVWRRGPQPVAVLEAKSAGLAAGIRINGGPRRPPSAPPDRQEELPAPSAPSSDETPAPASRQGASAAALRWLEGSFAGLREELQSLRGTLNQQQATLAALVHGLTEQQALLVELLEARNANLRLAAAVDALPGQVEEVLSHVADGQREAVAEIVGAVETMQGQAVSVLSGALEAGVDRIAHRDPAVAAAELRAFLESDGPTGSIVATIATQAATQSLRTEVASQLPRIVQKVTNRSEARMAELVEQMEGAVSRAVRPRAVSGAKTATRATSPAKPTKAVTAARATKATKTAATKTAAKKAAATKVTATKVTRASNGSKVSKTSKTSKTSRAAKATKSAATKTAKTATGSARVTRATSSRPAQASTRRAASAVRRASRP